MPRIEPELQRLQEIKSLPSLLKYLKEDLNWPIGSEDVEEVTFDYDPTELGFDSASTAKIDEVRQLRPLTAGQKWGIFWVKFGKKQLPVQMLRRALGNLVVKKRASTKKSDKAAWHMHDLLFISAYGDDSNRHITFAHFSESEDSEKSLPVLKVLGWDDDDTLLHLKDTYKTLVSSLNWENTPVDDPEAWREHWSAAFKVGHREVINTTKELVVKLAQLATVIKKSVLTSIKAETEKGPWKKLMLAFQKTLIKDLDEDQFADVIAQTVSYGLLTARLSSDGQISLKNLVDMVPSTNPFLKELLQHFLTSAGMKGLFDVDEAGINDVVELLNRANAQAIRNDFGKKTDGEDPVIHFYEHFLGEYNKKLKVERGVFYTPQPVVSYIVRSVHGLLQREFGLEDGLADTSTWADVKKLHKDLKIPEGVNPDIEPFVQILDPATGTATFLIEVIDVIYGTMTAKWDKDRVSKAEQNKKWNTYVPTYLLPRLYAYELMMAPYAIAHMKVGLKLTETGFTAWEKLGAENRANIFLTNAIEPWSAQLDLPGFNALAHEAAAVNEVKKNKRFTVVIGNPPYSNFGQLNKNQFIHGLLETYKQGLDEKKINLDDDFIKFICFSQHVINQAGIGIVGMITNNVFLDGLTHRRMRESLKSSFNDIGIVDLHGSSKKLEVGPDGLKEENVFEIQQGVGISLLSRSPWKLESTVRHSELWGSREKKYNSLQKRSAPEHVWTTLDCQAPHFFFVPKSFAGLEEYLEQPCIAGEVFLERNAGIQTKRDSLVYSFSKHELDEKIGDLRSSNKSALVSKYELPEDGRDWSVEWAKKDVKKSDGEILRVLYHPFDLRWTYFTGRSKGLMAYPRTPLMWSLLQPNLALLSVRNSRRGNIDSFFVGNKIIDKDAVSPFDNASFFPLYTYPNPANSQGTLDLNVDKRINLSPEFLRSFCKKLSLAQKQPHGLPQGFNPEDVFHYAYGVFNSPSYRSRYAEYLKIDFPRLPLTGNLKLFWELASLGSELTAMHLLESPKVGSYITEFIGGRTQAVEKTSWSANTVWIDKAQTVGFKGVPEAVWSFSVGGYQVCEKWLKDRKGRKLTKDDIEHYQKIVVALSETIRLMAEIDKVIDEHGGWPGAFQTAK
jgi:predicted helicase